MSLFFRRSYLSRKDEDQKDQKEDTDERTNRTPLSEEESPHLKRKIILQ